MISETYSWFCLADSGSDTESLESDEEPLVYEKPNLGMTIFIYCVSFHWSSILIFAAILVEL